MTFKISLEMAQLVVKDSLALKPNPSATTWSRLEPLPTSDDITPGLRAPVADPLWMLARQWQFNEFQGEDAGSPIGAHLSLRGVSMRRLCHPTGAVPERTLADAAPIEALVEHEAVLEVHAKLNAQAGQHLMRMLRAEGQAGVGEALRAKFAARIAPPPDAAADNAGFVWHQLLDARAIDARALAAELRPRVGNDGAIDALLAGAGVASSAPVRAVLARWLVWLDDLAFEPGTLRGASPYWNPQRLEYSFGLRSDGVLPELQLDADEYSDGRLDWHSFTFSAGLTTPGAPVLGSAPVAFKTERSPMPAAARYPGMPADRYWEFEDGRVNFGRMGAAKSDLARLALMEYALVFGNDWFVLPVTLAVNAVYKVDRFVITDNFGLPPVPVPPASNIDGTQWTMFEMSVKPGAQAPRARLNDCLYLCPALHASEGPPLEEVSLMRDEMANMAWAIEKKVQGVSGEPFDRRFESTRLSTLQSLLVPLGAAVNSGDAPSLKYTLQTPVAAHWIPFLPVRHKDATGDNWSIQLQRGVVVQHYRVDGERLVDPRNAQYAAVIARLRNAPFVEPKIEQSGLQGFMFHPRGDILQPSDDFLRLEDQEVPRDGVVVQRAFNYARDANGRALLWIGRSKKIGRGEGASGLRFDVVKR